MISPGDNWNAAWSTVTELIFRGLEGSLEDQNKSVRLACAAVEGCSNPDTCGEFIIRVLQRLIEVIPAASRTMNTQLKECIHCILKSTQLNEDWTDRLLWSLMKLLESSQDPRVLTHTLDLILSFNFHTSFFVVFAHFLYNLIRSHLASLNRDIFIHARLLRLLALLLPLMDLQPVLQPNSWLFLKWKELREQLEKEKMTYFNTVHRIFSDRMISRI